jgi:hypothetical protein
MSTSKRPGKPAARHAADTDLASSSASAPDTAASGDSTPDTTQQAGPVTGPPDDIQELRQEIAQTREDLGETVEQLAAKTDVKARAQHQAAKVAGKVKATAGHARAQAAASAGNARDQLAAKTGDTGEMALSAGTAAKERLSGWLVKTARPAWEATREPVRQAAGSASGTARRRRTPLLVAAGMLVAGYLAIRRWRRR